LTTACKCCDENGFKISGAKSAAVLFTKQRKPQPINLLLQDNAELPMKIEYNYLESHSREMALTQYTYKKWQLNAGLA